MRTIILTSAACSPAAIAALIANLEAFSHQDVEVLVLGAPGYHPAQVPDPAQFWSASDQLSFLSAYSPELARSLGYDSPVRSLAGLFKAWIDGASQVLLWDGGLPDASQDFLGAHLAAVAQTDLPQLSHPSAWVNIYSLLDKSGDPHVFPRGFPLDLRPSNLAVPIAVSEPRPTHVIAHVGLPLGPPDMDSISRIERQANSHGWSYGASLALAAGLWCPFPAANLMLRREAIPAYFLCGHLHNYGAVWGSLLLQKVAGHLGGHISFGAPFSPLGVPATDPWAELDQERPGLRRTGELAQILRNFPLQGATYGECIQKIAADLPLAWPQGSLRGPHAWSGYSVDWRKRFLEGLKLWAEACESAAALSKTNLYSALDTASLTKPSLSLV